MSTLLELTSHSDDCSSVLVNAKVETQKETSHKVVALHTPLGDLITVVWEYDGDGWRAKLYLPAGTKITIEEKNGQLTAKSEHG